MIQYNEEVLPLDQFYCNNNLIMRISDAEDTTDAQHANEENIELNVEILTLTHPYPQAETFNEFEALLNEWGFLHLKEKFASCGYNQVGDFKILSESDLDDLLPNAIERCQRARLRAKIVEWRKQHGFEVQVDLLSRTTASVTSSVNRWLEQSQSGISTPSHSSSIGLSPLRFNLKQFLKTDRGNKILKCYNSRNPPKLGDYERKILIDGILEYHYTNNLSITYEDFANIADDIESTIVCEDKNFYFHRVDKQRPSGKLYNKYKNQIPQLNKIGYYGKPKRSKFFKESKSIESPTTSDQISDTYIKDKEWLECMDHPNMLPATMKYFINFRMF